MCVNVCPSVCETVPRKRILGMTIKVIIIKLGTVTASDMVMHHVIIKLILTSIQGHTELNRKNNKRSIISEIVQAKPIEFAVKIVRLKVYMCIASPMTLTFTGHNCVSSLTTFYLVIIIYQTIFKLLHSNLA